MLKPRPLPSNHLFACAHYTRLERLARMFASTAPTKWNRDDAEPIHDSTKAGTFRVLPPELVDCIVAALLTINPRKLAKELVACTTAARSVFDFICTCRGAAAAVSRDNRFEAVARMVFESMTVMPSARPHRAFTELAMCSVRSTMEARVLYRMIIDQTTHCAVDERHCCRPRRDGLNLRLAQRPFEGEPHFQAMADASLGKGRTKMQVSVVATKHTKLLCATDRGVVLFPGPGHADRVIAVTAQPAEVYSPEGELTQEYVHVFKDTDERYNLMEGASEGHLLVLLLKRYLDDATLLAEAVIEVWDMQADALVDRRVVPNHVVNIWMHKGTVYRFTHTDATNVGGEGWPMRIDYYRPQSPPGSDEHVGGSIVMGNAFDGGQYSVSKGTGDVALIDTWPDAMEESLIFVDIEQRHYFTFETQRLSSPAPDAKSVVALSPQGNVMVMLGRSHTDPGVWVYRRDHRTYPHDDPRVGLGWSIHARSQCRWAGNCFPRPYRYPTAYGVFSPCGGTAWFFFRNADHGEHIAIDVRDVIKTGGCDSQQCLVWPAAIPTAVVWNNGIFLETGSRWGVLHIGPQ